MRFATLRTVLLATVLAVVVSGASATGAAPLGTAAAPSAPPAAAQLAAPTAVQAAGGNLWMYRGNGAGSWTGDRMQVGTGWNVMTAVIGVGDFSGDGFVDLLARDSTGNLWMYRGNGAGGWLGSSTRVGTGWNGMTAIIGVGDFSGDGFVDLLARDSTGNLWMYRGNGAGGWLGPGERVGTGWNVMTSIIGPGDFSGDGFVDVLARDASGYLWMYRGNGAGGWLGPGVRVGNGWNGMTAIIGVGDFSGDGFVDILARDSAGGAPVDCAVRACVALTFDDGPSAHTSRLLDSLISLQAPATFFVVGHQVAARPAIVRRQYANGFPVENHTYSHPQLTTLSLSAQQSEVNRADDAIVAAGVPRSTQLRPPYGSWNSNTRQLGKPLILWSVDPRDWDGRTASQIRSHIVANTTAGSIVLMHDSVSATVDAVPGIVADLRARGFTLVTVETLIPTLRPGDVVYSRTNINRAGSVGTLSEGPEKLRAPDGTVLGEVVDEAPFVPER